MSELSKEQLQQLTDEIMERLKEFEMPSAMLPTKGIVRVAFDVIAPFVREMMASQEHTKRLSVDRTTSAPEPEQATIAPLPSQISNADARRLRQLEFDAIIAALKKMAMGGIMPRMTTWDAAKPTDMPKAQAIINRYAKSWMQLAEIAGLKMDKRRGISAMEPIAHLNGTFNE